LQTVAQEPEEEPYVQYGSKSTIDAHVLSTFLS
jgi:hypothetical protein